MLVNLNREQHMSLFNKAISLIYEELNSKGMICEEILSERKERLEYLRETLHLVGNISINENDYNLIKNYIN